MVVNAVTRRSRLSTDYTGYLSEIAIEAQDGGHLGPFHMGDTQRIDKVNVRSDIYVERAKTRRYVPLCCILSPLSVMKAVRRVRISSRGPLYSAFDEST